MAKTSFAIHGDICHSKGPNELECVKDGYVVCEEGRSAGVFSSLPEQYSGISVLEYPGMLVLPGLVDLHVHAAQFAYRGTGMDVELLDWLERYAFPEEARFADLDYAERAYSRFVEDMRRGPNTRACVFASAHTEATLLLMDLLDESGLATMVGRVSMDQNAPDNLREPDAASAAAETIRWLDAVAGRHYVATEPALTPRFIPSCSHELLRALGEIRRQCGTAVQSHLSENRAEVELVRELCPDSRFYGEAYDSFGLFGGEGGKTVMAHCVLSAPPELELIRKRGVYIAHCPASNMNVSSGIAPVRSFLDMGLHVGLGSDVAGGTVTSIFRAMADSIQVSKLRWRLVDDSLKALTAPEAFWLGTAGGGEFFNTGSFKPGREFDAIVLSDKRYRPETASDIAERLERSIYLSDDRDIEHKFVRGAMLF
ncbi:MAG TPA: amidohydrolase family protein [Candidatus Scatomorpha merdavium]|nr:amidohydrolase family protein [Candidatus Scatomorpha merdavium]